MLKKINSQGLGESEWYSFTVEGKSRKFLDSNDGTENIPKFWGEFSVAVYGSLVNELCKGRTGAITGGKL